MVSKALSGRVFLDATVDDAWQCLLAFMASAGAANATGSAEGTSVPRQSVLAMKVRAELVAELGDESEAALDNARINYSLRAQQDGTAIEFSLEHPRLGSILSSPGRWLSARRVLKSIAGSLGRQVLVKAGAQSAVATGPHALAIPGIRDGLALYTHEEGHDLFVSEQIRRNAIWEEYETEIVCRLLRPGDTFIDVGANIGYYTALASRLVGPAGKVFAFEPDPNNFDLLAKNAQHNSLENSLIVNAALSADTSPGKLYLSPDNCGDHQIYAGDVQREHIPVALLNGSDFLQQHIASGDFIKVDTQGAEVGVIKGLLPFIEASLPDLLLITEFWPHGLGRSGHSGEEFLQLLLDAGFDKFIVVEHGERALIRTNPKELRNWIKLSESDPDCVGFINLLCTRESTPVADVDNDGFFPRKNPQAAS